MKICIDGLGLNKLEGTGLYTYSYGLIKNLLQFYPQSEYHIIWDDSTNMINSWASSVHLGSIEIDRINNDYLNLEKYLIENKIKIFHSPNNGFSFSQNISCNKVITVHDLIALSDMKYVDEKYKNKFRSTFPIIIKWADKIIAVSEFIKKQIINYYDVAEDNIEVVYPTFCLDDTNIKENDIKKVLNYNYHIKDDFILFSGSIHPRKNLKSIIYIFKKVLEENPSLKLIIVGRITGKRETYYKELCALIQRLNILESVIFTGIVPLNDMYLFYKQCKCFINISEYEGFPITVMEALTCKAPTICSDIPSMREVAGNKAIFVNPQDSEQIISTLIKIIWSKSPMDDSLEYIKKFDTVSQINKLIRIYEGFV